MLDAIEYLLMHGGSIGLPYKKNLPDWFATGGVKLGKDDGKYVIWGSGCYGQKKKNLTRWMKHYKSLLKCTQTIRAQFKST